MAIRSAYRICSWMHRSLDDSLDHRTDRARADLWRSATGISVAPWVLARTSVIELPDELGESASPGGAAELVSLADTGEARGMERQQISAG